jgi:GH43 family beta-xylosidase
MSLPQDARRHAAMPRRSVTNRLTQVLAFLLAGALCLGAGPAQRSGRNVFSNPLTTRSSPHPWLIWYRGSYYFTFTQGGRVELWRSRTLTGFRGIREGAAVAGIGGASGKVIWQPNSAECYPHDVWAPELQRLNGRWYVYFTASAGPDASHRLFVLEGDPDDPIGPYTVKHRIEMPGDDLWAIDPTVLRYRDVL